MKHASVKQRGFSLIEVIIVLTAAALVGAFIYSFFGRSYLEGMKAGSNVAKSQGLQKVMENIISDYKKNFTTNLAGLQAKVGAEGSDMANSYGAYKVIDNHFLQSPVVSGTWSEQIGTGVATDLLKVTIKNEPGETLTIVFSPQ